LGSAGVAGTVGADAGLIGGRIALLLVADLATGDRAKAEERGYEE
jgi:hypothetical protein